MIPVFPFRDSSYKGGTSVYQDCDSPEEALIARFLITYEYLVNQRYDSPEDDLRNPKRLQHNTMLSGDPDTDFRNSKYYGQTRLLINILGEADIFDPGLYVYWIFCCWSDAEHYYHNIDEGTTFTWNDEEVCSASTPGFGYPSMRHILSPATFENHFYDFLIVMAQGGPNTTRFMMP